MAVVSHVWLMVLIPFFCFASPTAFLEFLRLFMCFLREWFQTEASEHLLEGRAEMLAESVVEARAVREEEVQNDTFKEQALVQRP